MTSGGCASGIPTRYGMVIAVYIDLIVSQRPHFGGARESRSREPLQQEM